jgi:hypothetical protein
VLDRDALDGLAARVLESGMVPAVALTVTDRDRTVLAHISGEAVGDGPRRHVARSAPWT